MGKFVEIECAAELSGAAQSPFASAGHPQTENWGAVMAELG